jgi:hypothetical protein
VPRLSAASLEHRCRSARLLPSQRDSKRACLCLHCRQPLPYQVQTVPSRTLPATPQADPAAAADDAGGGEGAAGPRVAVTEAQRLRGMVDAINELAAVQPVVRAAGGGDGMRGVGCWKRACKWRVVPMQTIQVALAPC